MTDTEAGLLATICATPDDDNARLVYADYLEERGRAEHAEFVRVQLELAGFQDRLDACPVGRASADGSEIRELAMRHRRLLEREQELLACYTVDHRGDRTSGWFAFAGDVVRLMPSSSPYVNHLTYRRGLVSGLLDSPPQKWLLHADYVLRTVPIVTAHLRPYLPSDFEHRFRGNGRPYGVRLQYRSKVHVDEGDRRWVPDPDDHPTELYRQFYARHARYFAAEWPTVKFTLSG